VASCAPPHVDPSSTRPPALEVTTTTGSAASSGTATQPYRTAPSSSQSRDSTQEVVFSQEFAKLVPRIRTRSVGLAYLPVGGRGSVVELGDWHSGPAWSTSKVPLALAALRATPGARTEDLVRRALTSSDNAAAERLWSDLGSGPEAAQLVDRELGALGDTTTRTQGIQIRPPYTPFGQTQWSLADQVRFASGLACASGVDFVRTQMASVSVGQRWGLGSIPGALFKGGWGPDPIGRYLVRQLGIVELDGHRVAVALAVEASDGSFASGVAAADKLVSLLRESLHPVNGGCN